MKPFSILLLFGLLSTIMTSQKNNSNQSDGLRNSITFYASFDGTTEADFSAGDRRIHTAASYDKLQEAVPGFSHPDVSLASQHGRFGDALNFDKKSKQVIFYPAKGNVNYQTQNWSGTVSFWLQLDPEKDLEPGYCDPIQITDAAYNDAALWVDFTDKNPRDFRLGVIGDLTAWKPDNTDDEAAFLEQLVPSEETPFSRTKWTQVVICFSNLNSDKGEAKFYLDGKLQGIRQNISDPFTWDISEARIILGLNYVGLFDELVVFKKALSDKEVARLYQLEEGVKTLFQ